MKKNTIYILFSLVLSLASSSYIWYDFLNDHQIAIELETERQEESLEEQSDNPFFYLDNISTIGGWHSSTNSLTFQSISYEFLSFGNYRQIYVPKEKLITLYCQLRIAC